MQHLGPANQCTEKLGRFSLPVEVPYILCDGSGRALHGSRVADYGLISSPKGVPYPHKINIFMACSTIRNGRSIRHALLKWWAIESDLLNEYPNVEKIVSANCITCFVTTLVLRDRCHRLFARLSRPSPNIRSSMSSSNIASPNFDIRQEYELVSNYLDSAVATLWQNGSGLSSAKVWLMQARQYTSTLGVGCVFGVQAIHCRGGFAPKEDSPYFSNADLNDLGAGFADGQVPKGERTVSKVKHLEEHDPFVTRDLRGSRVKVVHPG